MTISTLLLLLTAATEPTCPAGTQQNDLNLADGSVSSSCTDPEGLPQGPMWNRSPNGRLRWVERYSKGRPNGTWVRFSRDGALIERRDYSAGVLDGAWERWYADGRPSMNVPVEGGEKSGEARGWYRDGKPDFQASFAGGLPDGQWRLFNRDGKLQARCAYGDGKEESRQLESIERPLERVHVVERLAQVKTPVKFCYDRELALRPELSRGGRVDFKFLVTPVGLTAGVELERSSLNDPAVESCIEDVIQQLRFPRLVTCELVEVAFPFELVAKP